MAQHRTILKAVVAVLFLQTAIMIVVPRAHAQSCTGGVELWRELQSNGDLVIHCKKLEELTADECSYTVALMRGTMLNLLRSFRILASLLAMIGTTLCAQAIQGPVGAVPPSGAVLFSLAASAVPDVVQAGAPVKVTVITTNISSQQIDFYVNTSERAGWAYGVDVRDENGNTPPDTKLGRTFKYQKSPNVGPGTFLTMNGAFSSIQPGAATSDLIDVSTLYDFSLPGKYSIQMQRFGDHDVLVKSNTITVTIVPSPNAQPASSTAVQPPLSITITSPTGKSVKSGSPIGLVVASTNTTGHNILLWGNKAGEEQAGSAYQIDIQKVNGATPPDTSFGHRAKARVDVPRNSSSAQFVDQSGEKLVLKPGESWWDTMTVNDLYDVRQPGDYTIQVERFDPATKTMVKSNTITVTVTP
jgi:hypothetical protein